MINLIYIGSDIGNITLNALEAIRDSDIIMNYDNLDLTELDYFLKDKEIISTIGESDSASPDSNESIYSKLEQSYSKIELSISKSFDNNLTLICSNNSNIQAISNLLIQISSKYHDVKLKIYPGVSPIDYTASILGAPLNDFVAINLNNPIVSSTELENKINLAIENNLVLFIHNLIDKLNLINNEDKFHNFKKLKEIITNFNNELLVGIVNMDSYEICQFEDIDEGKLEENSTLIIGNKLTYQIDDYMITSSDYIVEPKFISYNMEFFEKYLNGESPKGLDYDCDYLPCHKSLEACDFCYCPFYPCADGITGGLWIKDKGVWSCQNCDWIHLEKPCQYIREGLDDILEDVDDLKNKHIELLKLRRRCLLKTLK